MLILIVRFFTVGMTGHTVSDVKNIFISMFLNHLLLLVAGGTGINGRIIACMTGTALSIGIAMIERERVGKVYITEVAGVYMATTAGAGKMIRGWAVASGAVRAAHQAVVKADIEEVRRVDMAGAAGAGKVVWRRAVALAAVALANDAVVKGGIRPLRWTVA